MEKIAGFPSRLRKNAMQPLQGAKTVMKKGRLTQR